MAAARTIEERLRAIEDRLEILNLIAAHPPSADTGAGAYIRSVWTEDGEFDRGLSVGKGNRALGEMVEAPAHRQAIAEGIAHFCGLPHVTIEGDTAVVISYLQILTPKRGGEEVTVANHGTSRGFHVHRVGANRWELVRTAAGWKIRRRAMRLLDGSPEAPALLKHAVGG